MKVLSNHGYKIIKKEYSTNEIKEIKDELTVKPRTFGKTNSNENKSVATQAAARICHCLLYTSDAADD